MSNFTVIETPNIKCFGSIEPVRRFRTDSEIEARHTAEKWYSEGGDRAGGVVIFSYAGLTAGGITKLPFTKGDL